MRTLLVLALFGLSCAKASPVEWHVTNGFIRDQYGRAVTLRGTNISQLQKFTPYLDSKTIADYQRMRDQWGFNSIRFVMPWAAIEPQQGVFDDTYLNGLAERMSWAEQLGLYVILDMHQDVFGEGFGFDGAPAWACPATNYAGFVAITPWSANELTTPVEDCFDNFYSSASLQQEYVNAWQHVAEKTAGYSSVLGFDIMNEPEWGTYDYTKYEHLVLQPFYEKVITGVRAKAPHWLAFVEPGISRSYGIPTGLTPFPDADVVYAPHSYNGLAEEGQPYPDNPSSAASLASFAAQLQGEAQMLHAALWVGEYGGATDTDPNVTAYMKAQYDAFGAVAGSSAYWEYGDNDQYGILNPDGSEKPELIAAIVRPYPTRTAGDPVSYAYDPDTSTFTFVYTPDTKITQPTEITVPSRLYPSGFKVDCSGCTWSTTSTGLNITKPGSGSPLTVTVHD